MNHEALPTAEDGYELLDSAEKVQRAFAEGRAVECRDVPGDWFRAGESWPPAIIRDSGVLIAVGIQYRAPKPAEPAGGRIDDGGPYNGIDIRGIVDALIQSAFDDGESGVEEYGERVRECRDDLLRAIGRLTTPTAERQASAVRELVAKWRGEAAKVAAMYPNCNRIGQLGVAAVSDMLSKHADELERLADAAPDVCATCQGHGVVGYHTGQTPEQYEEHTADCPDCTPAPPVAAEAVAITDAMVERALSAPYGAYSVSSFIPLKSPHNIRELVRAALEAAFAHPAADDKGELDTALGQEAENG